MSGESLLEHYVCTYDEVQQLLDDREQFWVANCGCRVSAGSCSQSRVDLCLNFLPRDASEGGDLKEVSREQVQALVDEARDSSLVPRPFRNTDDGSVEGICFCCTCCCAYFQTGEEQCDRGQLVENTAMELCTHCGICTEACPFAARTLEIGGLAINQDKCYGCGLCLDICPEQAIAMKPRRPA